MSERIIVREVNKAYEIPVKVLCERAGFSVVTLLDRDETPIQSKSAWLKQGISASIRLIIIRSADPWYIRSPSAFASERVSYFPRMLREFPATFVNANISLPPSG